MIRERIAKLGRIALDALRNFRRKDPPPQDAVPVAGSPFEARQYVRIHPRMAILIAAALRGWSPRFAAKPRVRKQAHEHTHARQRARILRQQQRVQANGDARAVRRLCELTIGPKELQRRLAARDEVELREYIERRRAHVARAELQAGYARPGFLAALTLAALALVACSGCASVELSRSEIAWQTLHAVDVAQTLDGPADDFCFREGNPVTRELIGAKPSTEKVIAWGVGSAVAHALVSSWLDDHAPRVAKVWQFVSIAEVGATVANNHALGIRIGTRNKTPAGCNR